VPTEHAEYTEESEDSEAGVLTADFADGADAERAEEGLASVFSVCSVGTVPRSNVILGVIPGFFGSRRSWCSCSAAAGLSRRDARRRVTSDQIERFAAAGDAEGVRLVERADARGAGFEAVLAECEGNVVEVVGADLNHGAEFFGEEGRENFVALGNLEVDAGVAGEGHLDDGGEEAAVGAVVVSEEFFLAAEELDRVPEFFEVGGVVDIGRGFAHLRNGLREDGAAEAVFAAAEVDEEEDGVAERIVIAKRAGALWRSIELDCFVACGSSQ
jgi:hypothetical protein